MAPHTFKNKWPEGRGINVLTLCKYINTSSVRSCTYLDRKSGNFKLKKSVSVLTRRDERVNVQLYMIAGWVPSEEAGCTAASSVYIHLYRPASPHYSSYSTSPMVDRRPCFQKSFRWRITYSTYGMQDHLCISLFLFKNEGVKKNVWEYCRLRVSGSLQKNAARTQVITRVIVL